MEGEKDQRQGHGQAGNLVDSIVVLQFRAPGVMEIALLRPAARDLRLRSDNDVSGVERRRARAGEDGGSWLIP